MYVMHTHGPFTPVAMVTQIFNEINSRKVHDEVNVFKGLMNNKLFIAIIVGTIAVQVVIIEVTGQAFKVTSLDWDQWIACVVRGARAC